MAAAGLLLNSHRTKCPTIPKVMLKHSVTVVVILRFNMLAGGRCPRCFVPSELADRVTSTCECFKATVGPSWGKLAQLCPHLANGGPWQWWGRGSKTRCCRNTRTVLYLFLALVLKVQQIYIEVQLSLFWTCVASIFCLTNKLDLVKLELIWTGVYSEQDWCVRGNFLAWAPVHEMISTTGSSYLRQNFTENCLVVCSVPCQWADNTLLSVHHF